MKRIMVRISACVVLCLMISLAGCDSANDFLDKITTPQTSQGSKPVISSNNNPLPEKKEEPVQKEIVKQRKTEDTFTIGGVNVTVHGLEITSRIDNGYGYFSPDEGNQYAVISVTVENTGKEAVEFLPYYALYGDTVATLLYAAEYEYSANTLLGYDSDLHGTRLNPLTSKDGVIVFEIPDTVVNGSGALALVLSAGDASEEVIVR